MSRRWILYQCETFSHYWSKLFASIRLLAFRLLRFAYSCAVYQHPFFPSRLSLLTSVYRSDVFVIRKFRYASISFGCCFPLFFSIIQAYTMLLAVVACFTKLSHMHRSIVASSVHVKLLSFANRLIYLFFLKKLRNTSTDLKLAGSLYVQF